MSIFDSKNIEIQNTLYFSIVIKFTLVYTIFYLVRIFYHINYYILNKNLKLKILFVLIIKLNIFYYYLK